MWKILVIILVVVLVWGLVPAHHKFERRSCDFSFVTQTMVCEPWEVTYFWDYGWLVKAVMGNRLYEQ